MTRAADGRATPDRAAELRRLIASRVDAVDALVGWYRADPVDCARWCDKEADRSGALLGWLREAARS